MDMEALPAAALALEQTAFTTNLQSLLLQCYCRHALNLTPEKTEEVLSGVSEWTGELASNPEKEVGLTDPDLHRNVLRGVEILRVVKEHILGGGTQKPLEGLMMYISICSDNNVSGIRICTRMHVI